MTRIVVVLCLALCSAAGVLAKCSAPQYRTGFILADSNSDFIASISIPLPDFAPARLICLANTLKERFRARGSVIVNIFSSRRAARCGFPIIEDAGAEIFKLFGQMHAQYVLDASKHEEYLVLKPEGDTPMLKGGRSDTRVDLPVVGNVHCRPEVNGRCVIAFQTVGYPRVSGDRPSGRVTLAGAIAPDGKISHIRVVKIESRSGGGTDALAKAAVQNLTSWRLEPEPRQEAIQITFSYVIDGSLRYKGETKVDWALPNEVTIRGSPPE